MPLTIGLTGGIGSGKSTASQWFEQQRIAVVDADIVAREVVQQGQPALQEIEQAFGAWVLEKDGTLNRKALRSHIFQNKEARQVLENITHPKIRESIIHQLQTIQSPYGILVSPLLFETQQDQLTQRTLLIDCNEATQISRASQRDQQSIEQIKMIIATQMSPTEKQKRATDIVLNDTSQEFLFSQLRALHLKYLALSEVTE
ncbi:dephospho-CoA kinase [Acinetobacter nectaris]|uniref:dephospho-CoA kinase n=1 Tax=Acinetobacter nectaris TaxID=1219382 RepID=UPI001EEDC3E2|nr:dephospho-CoA kinase [Acinetobacter nectaris]MCF9000089.1 dephospho-CoA kinase [Acinetobacter nectaris]MCF9027159.1 dephospho-CoA kinase [Acinetobacter nectaris]